ncbi:MAG: ABC transporter permease [Ferruginibacter sp.]
MLKNYIKIAWRNIFRHKFHSLLNILGLSIGIAFTLLIAAYVWNELNVNSALPDLDNQYIVQSNWKDPAMGLELTTLGPMVKALKDEYPSLVKNYYRWDGVTSNVSKADRIFREGLQIGDSTFLNMYGFTLLYGDKATALKEPFTAVITEDRAMKYFGKKDVVGQTLSIESFSGSRHDFTITGVMKMPATNSLTRVNPDNDNQIYIPAVSAAYFSRSLESWDNPYMVGYLQLQPGIKPQDLKVPMQRILKRSAPPFIAGNMQPYLAPLKDYYLKQKNGLVSNMICTVSIIAFFILLMAMINFVNISIGKSSTRIKEIGVRKVMGGMQSQIICQFLIESLLLVCFAMILALIMYHFANPFLSAVLGNQIPSLNSFPVYYALIPLALIFITGFIAGIYPAFILSALKTADSVKGKLQSVNSNIVLRKTLVGFQFFAASIVLIGAIILAKQVSLFFSKDLGYDKEFVVSVQLPRDWSDAGVQRMESFRDEFAGMPQVSTASLTWSVPDGTGSGTTMLFADGQDLSQAIPYESVIADKNYLSMFKIPVKSGRAFEPLSDSSNIVINQSAVKTLGLEADEDAIGKRLYYAPDAAFTVIAVMGDFHFGSMKQKIKPMILTDVNFNKVYRLMCFKLKPGNIAETMAALHKKWLVLMPGSSFEYLFMDDSLNRLYKSEIQLKKASEVATLLALIIVTLGIIGLVSLSIQQRIKEIGIRKVLGASVTNIGSLFMKEFLPVLIIAALIAIPFAWFMMQHWLKDYNYRITITAQPFVISIFSLGLITSLLIIFQVSKAALQNPVKSLRTE